MAEISANAALNALKLKIVYSLKRSPYYCIVFGLFIILNVFETMVVTGIQILILQNITSSHNSIKQTDL
jgi:hypothetical protein